MNTWFDSMIIWLDAYFHSIGFHFYTLPAIGAGLLALVMGLVHWRNRRKRNETGKTERQELLNTYLTTGEGAFR